MFVRPEWFVGCPNDRSIAGFCTRNGGSTGPMSKAFYFKMRRLGLGPRETRVLGRISITAADEAAWQKRHAAPRTTEDRLRRAEQAERRRRRALGAVTVALRNPNFARGRQKRRAREASP